MSSLNKNIRDCIFYSEFKDHNASIPCCCFAPCDGDRSLYDDVLYLEKNCPCHNYVTVDDVRHCLLVDGFHP